MESQSRKSHTGWKNVNTYTTSMSNFQSQNKASTNKWRKTLGSLNFKHSSQTAWSLLQEFETGNKNHQSNRTPLAQRALLID